MPAYRDGPGSVLFRPVHLRGNVDASGLAQVGGVSEAMAAECEHAPSGSCVCWGIPFEISDSVIVVAGDCVSVDIAPTKARWWVFAHTSDLRQLEPGPGGIISPMHGQGQLGEHAADYVIVYADGMEERLAIRRRYQVGAFQRRWGEN